MFRKQTRASEQQISLNVCMATEHNLMLSTNSSTNPTKPNPNPCALSVVCRTNDLSRPNGCTMYIGSRALRPLASDCWYPIHTYLTQILQLYIYNDHVINDDFLTQLSVNPATHNIIFSTLAAEFPETSPEILALSVSITNLLGLH